MVYGVKVMKVWPLLICLFGAVGAWATLEGDSGIRTPYFSGLVHNAEYMPGTERHPTSRERAEGIAAHWRHFIRAYRAVQAHPSARKALMTHPLSFYDLRYNEYEPLYRLLRPHGVSRAQIDRQVTTVYTVQLGAYRQARSIQRLLRPFPDDGDVRRMMAMPVIYATVPKTVQLWYGSELVYKFEPLYLMPGPAGTTRVRYGVYENTVDARIDIPALERRYGTHGAYTVRVPLTGRLVERMYWGTLPGKFRGV